MSELEDSPVFGYVRGLAVKAKEAARELSQVDSDRKDAALTRMADYINSNVSILKEENQKDLSAAREKGLPPTLIERLELTCARIQGMTTALSEIAQMRDPVGEVVCQWKRPGGFEVGQLTVPLGVVGIIYESRPNVTADASGLCFKAGNATLLRGGSEALNSNRAIVHQIREALTESGVNENAVQMVETPDRIAVSALLKLNGLVDVIIPRGGKGLIGRVIEESTIPVIKHYEGICHVFVDREADLNMARRIAVNAKVQRPATCNAMETLLVDAQIASDFLPLISEAFRTHGVRIHGCRETARYVEVDQLATEEHFRTEYLSLTCNIRLVQDLDEALEHIAAYGSRHTDVIVTNSYNKARRFVREVDASSVMVNASPRLADGSVYGLGAEIGISTDKLHAYGPMGVRELTAKKFVVYGNGSLRE